MKTEEFFPKITELFVCRNFNVGDRVKVLFNKKFFPGVVVKKYKESNEETPYVLVNTDERVSNDPGAFLDGFGLEYVVDYPFLLFEYETGIGDEVYTRTIEREMTKEEKENWGDSPF